MGPRLTPAARALLLRQRGVIGCWQGSRVGVTARALRAAANRSQDWRWVGYRTVSPVGPRLSASQQRMVACLETSPRSMLGGVAALQESGWDQGGDGKIDVIVPRGDRASRRRLPMQIRLHYAGDLVSSSVAIPRTATERAVVDAVAWARTDREASFIVTSVLQQRLVGADQVLREVAARVAIKRSRLLKEILTEFVGGAHSIGEMDFVRECRRRGLPEPDRQVRRVGAAGRIRFTDAEFLRADGRLVMVEIDGVGHMSADTWLADMDRHNELTLATGALVLRVSNWQVRNDPEPFFRKLKQALERS